MVISPFDKAENIVGKEKLLVNSLSNDKILDESKFKASADDNTIVTQKLKYVLGRVENIMGKGENAGY